MTTLPIENITDDDARLIINNELYKNIYVEAGAGTGKTTSLVDRIVSLIRQGRVPIDQIVASHSHAPRPPSYGRASARSWKRYLYKNKTTNKSKTV